MDQRIPGAFKEINKMCLSAFSGWEVDILAGHSLVHMDFQVKARFKSFLLIEQFLKTGISFCLKSSIYLTYA